MPEGRPLSLFAVGSWQCEFAIHDFRLAIASGHSGICVAATPRRRALRGNGLIPGRRLADAMARAPSPRVRDGRNLSA